MRPSRQPFSFAPITLGRLNCLQGLERAAACGL